MKSIGDRFLGVCVDWKHHSKPYTIPISTTRRLLAIGRRCSVCSLPATRFGAKLRCHQREVKRNGNRFVDAIFVPALAVDSLLAQSTYLVVDRLRHRLPTRSKKLVLFFTERSLMVKDLSAFRLSLSASSYQQ